MSESDNILIVDDNPNNLHVLAGILQDHGYKVRPALSGEMALRAIDAHLPDLILLDVRMPGMDGYETCRRLKTDGRKRDIPVIFISALNEVEDKLNAFRAGAVDYITKPFQSEEVLARVNTQMALAGARHALAATNARLVGLMEQLVQSEKLKSLGSLAAGVAHELNTPIGNAILGAGTIAEAVRQYSEALAAGKPAPSLEELLATCHAGADLTLRNLNRAGKLIRALKYVSVDRTSERRRRIDLRDAVVELMAIMESVVRKTPYVVSIDIEPGLVLETYPGHLEQILDNLIRNSITHGFDGAASGNIRISARGDKNGRVALLVADDGKGIAEEHRSRVFDPFFTTRLGQGGSGLGLHICYTLATGILGGSISVSSTPGAGTQFTLSLPPVAPALQDPINNDGDSGKLSAP